MKTLKIKTLDKDWRDADEIMLHAVMQILVDYVEKEKPEENIDWDWNEKHKQAWKVISDTYDWWKTRRPCREDILQDVVIPDDYMTFGEQDENGNYPVIWGDYPEISEKMAEANRLETERYEEDTEMMRRIISVREYMWT